MLHAIESCSSTVDSMTQLKPDPVTARANSCCVWSAAKRPAEDRKASSKKAHNNYAKVNQEIEASKLTVEEEAKADVKEAMQDGDKEATKVQAQVNKEDADFDPDNAAELEVEPIPADEADDAGE